jgi:outer membrane lipoprotein-sorting protein
MKSHTMRTTHALAAIILAGPPIAESSAQTASDPKAEALLAAVDKILFMESYSSRARMETVEPGSQSRVMVFTGLSRRDKGTYMEIAAPERTKGTRFLQLEGSLWMYNPKSNSANPLRLSGIDSFQGSAFSNADLGKARFSGDYVAGFDGEMEYYAKSGLLFKRMDLSAIRDFGSIVRPSVLRMESLEKKGTITTLTLESIEIKDVSASIFNKNYLTR